MATAVTASSAPGPTAPGSSTPSRSTTGRHLHHEDTLSRTWRSITHSVVLVTSKAEKVAKEPTKDSAKELNEATIGFLRNKLEWSRSIAYLEAKLAGKAAEMEAREHFVRSHASLRKRKREDVLAGDAKKPSTETLDTPSLAP